MQNVWMPMWSKFSSSSVVRFITTPTHTQITTAAENASVRMHLFRFVFCMRFMLPSHAQKRTYRYRYII